jgi:nucleoside-diphosphate-sugar epimerase
MGVPSKKRIFITGIDGFSGKHLENHLIEKGFDVYGSTFSAPNKSNHFKCDILSKKDLNNALEGLYPDFIIHLAAISFVANRNIPQMYETNILGTLNLLDVLIEKEIRPSKILISSSAAVYGNIGNVLAEDMAPKPVNHYGNSKLAMENMVSNYFEKLNIIITRPFNYTGPGQEEHFLVPKIVSHFKRKASEIALGNLYTLREYNDVKFISNCYLALLMSSLQSDIINVCSGITHSIQEIIQTMEKISSHSIEIKVDEQFIRKNEIKELKGSDSKLKSIIGNQVEKPILENTLYQMFQN